MSDLIPNEKSFVLYTAADGSIIVEAYIKDETLWLTQQKIAEVLRWIEL